MQTFYQSFRMILVAPSKAADDVIDVLFASDNTVYNVKCADNSLCKNIWRMLQGKQYVSHSDLSMQALTTIMLAALNGDLVLSDNIMADIANAGEKADLVEIVTPAALQQELDGRNQFANGRENGNGDD